ncbi:MAG: hypothetical protein K9M44_01115 [Candidatus Pacebacteria bacterium]|nr:hypothetical protein [Candidatus Paceibacterota bacterium]
MAENKRSFLRLKLRLIFREIFYFLLLSLVSFSLLEIIWPGSVLAYFNLNLLLLICLLVAILLIYWPKK